MSLQKHCFALESCMPPVPGALVLVSILAVAIHIRTRYLAQARSMVMVVCRQHMPKALQLGTVCIHSSWVTPAMHLWTPHGVICILVCVYHCRQVG